MTRLEYYYKLHSPEEFETVKAVVERISFKCPDMPQSSRLCALTSCEECWLMEEEEDEKNG